MREREIFLSLTLKCQKATTLFLGGKKRKDYGSHSIIFFSFIAARGAGRWDLRVRSRLGPAGKNKTRINQSCKKYWIYLGIYVCFQNSIADRTTYFSDGERKIDFVLVYEEKTASSSSSAAAAGAGGGPPGTTASSSEADDRVDPSSTSASASASASTSAAPGALSSDPEQPGSGKGK